MGRRSAFTLIEILVAAGIFTLFFGGAYALYRAGTDMYLTGTWKLTKQKEAQRFLTILKERLEMASKPTRVNPQATDNTRINAAAGPVYLTPSPEDIPFSRAPANIILFSICKPDLSAAGGLAGLVFSHVIRMVPQADGLASQSVCTLVLHGNTGNSDPMFVTTVSFPPDSSGLNGNFGALPNQYQLGAVPFEVALRDVSSVQLGWQLASGTIGTDECPKIVDITVNMANPRHPQTQISQRIRARLDASIQIEARTVGGL